MQKLPVESQRLYMEHWLREVPYANVPEFDVDLPPGISKDLFRLITGYVIKELQDGASKNIVRTTLHNLTTHNNRNNDRFLSILLAAAEYTAIKLNSAESPEETIRNAVIATVAVAAATTLHDYPTLKDILSIGQQVEFDKILEMGAEIKNEVKTKMFVQNSRQVHHQQQQRHQPQQQQQPELFPAFDPRTQQPVCDDQGVHLWTDTVNLYHPLDIGAPVTYPYAQQAPQGNGRYTPAMQPQYQQARSAGPIVNNRWGNDTPTVSVNPDRFNQTPSRQQMQPQERPQHAMKGVQEEWDSDKGLTNTANQPKVTTGLLRNRNTVAPEAVSTGRKSGTFVVNTETGERRPVEEVRAQKSTVSWGATVEQPYPLAYDPVNTVLDHVIYSDQTVSHVIKDREGEEDLDYLQHELDPKLRAQHVRDLEQAKKRITKGNEPIKVLDSQRGMMEVVESNASTIAEFGDKEVLEVAETVYLEDEDGAINCSTLTEGIGICEQKLRKHRISPKTTFAFNANVQQKYIITKADEDLINEVKLREADFDAVAGIMATYQSLVDKPTRLWYVINERLTAIVNNILKYGIGSKASIDSFVEDAPKLNGYLVKKYGIKVANIINDIEETVIFKVFNNITTEDVDGVLMATLSESVLAAVLPVTAMELRVNFDKQGYGLVVPRNLPVLHHMLRKMVNGLMPLDRAVIVTSDNITLDIRKGLLIPDTILLSV